MAQRGPKVRATAASGNKMDSSNYIAKEARREPKVVVPDASGDKMDSNTSVTSKKAMKGAPEASGNKMDLNTSVIFKKATKGVTNLGQELGKMVVTKKIMS